MRQLHILLMKHEPKSCFQSSTNIPSNLLCKHLSWNPDNKELTFNAFITFASWKRKKKREMLCVNRILLFMEIKCQKQIWNSLTWPCCFLQFSHRVQKKEAYTWILNKFKKTCIAEGKKATYFYQFLRFQISCMRITDKTSTAL